MKTKNYLEIAKILLKIAKKAYKTCSKQNVEVKDKGIRDLLTTLDTSIEAYIIKELTKLNPEAKVVSEEFNSKVKPKGTYFIIDPIDGTINFVNKFDFLWAVQLAYVEDDNLVASAIYFPCADEYFAAKGFGSYKNGKRFFTEKKDPIHSLVCLDTKDNEFYAAVYNVLDEKVLRFRKFGATCADSTSLAEGKFGGFVIEKAKPWDLLPGQLIMLESGCVMKKIKDCMLFATSEDFLALLKKSVEDTYKNLDKKKKS